MGEAQSKGGSAGGAAAAAAKFKQAGQGKSDHHRSRLRLTCAVDNTDEGRGEAEEHSHAGEKTGILHAPHYYRVLHAHVYRGASESG